MFPHKSDHNDSGRPKRNPIFDPWSWLFCKWKALSFEIYDCIRRTSVFIWDDGVMWEWRIGEWWNNVLFALFLRRGKILTWEKYSFSTWNMSLFAGPCCQSDELCGGNAHRRTLINWRKKPSTIHEFDHWFKILISLTWMSAINRHSHHRNTIIKNDTSS